MRLKGLQTGSFLLSTVALIGVILTNREIANRYIMADGKTKALFGLIELSFLYKYYFLIPASLALVLELIAMKRNGTKQYDYLVLTSVLLSIVLVFFPVWKLMV